MTVPASTSIGHDEGYSTACVTMPISKSKLAQLEERFPRVLYRPDGKVSDDELKEVDIWYTSWTGLPANVETLDQIPRTRVVQLSSGKSADIHVPCQSG
jgi:hypothetical protein